jgi:isopentenyldiphosphate isomerase
MADLIDVLDSRGLRTGEILPRAVHVYLWNAKNEVLLQKRAASVDNYPNVFSISVLGHVNAGERSAATAKREVEEELGIEAAGLRFEFMFSYYSEAVLSERYHDRQFNDVYLLRLDVYPKLIKFDTREVADVKFVPFDEFERMVNDRSPELAPVYGDECRDLVYFLRQG